MKIVLLVLGVFLIGKMPLSIHTNNMTKFCLFSELNGIVLNNGIPVENATVRRTYYWVWKNEIGEDMAKTNEKGEFHFSAIFGKTFFGFFLPHEPTIDQEIKIISDQTIFIAWYHVKQTYKEGGELGEYNNTGRFIPKPIFLNCELTTPVNPIAPMAGRANLITK
jgi:hypothetical protein